jgi:hypothetical protein
MSLWQGTAATSALRNAAAIRLALPAAHGATFADSEMVVERVLLGHGGFVLTVSPLDDASPDREHHPLSQSCPSWNLTDFDAEYSRPQDRLPFAPKIQKLTEIDSRY